MAIYRLNFMIGDSIKATQDVEAADDESALLEAKKLILVNTFFAVMVWQQNRFIGRISIAPDLKIIQGGKSKSEP